MCSMYDVDNLISQSIVTLVTSDLARSFSVNMSDLNEPT